MKNRESNKDRQDRKRQDMQDNKKYFLIFYPVYPGACDPAYHCYSLSFFSSLRLCAFASLRLNSSRKEKFILSFLFQ
jgi:hypothetical protein